MKIPELFEAFQESTAQRITIPNRGSAAISIKGASSMDEKKATEQFVKALLSKNETTIRATGDQLDAVVGFPGYSAEYRRGFEKGSTAERARCERIIMCPEAKGRGPFAMHLALNTDFSAEQCGAMLKASAPNAAGDAGSYLAPFIKPAAGSSAGPSDEEAREAVAKTVALYLGSSNTTGTQSDDDR